MTESVVSRTSLSARSETLVEIVCQPCTSEGKNAEAEGYCQNCCEHLCSHCLSCHKKCSMSKFHKLVDKGNMPNQQETPTTKDVCTERCRIHNDEIIKYYCPAHKVLACTECLTLNHTSCKNVAYIPEIITGLESSQYYKDLKAKLEYLIQKSKDNAEFSQDSKQRSSDCLSKAIHDIDTYRQEIIDAVDTKFNELKDHARKIHAHDMDKMNSVANNNNEVLTKLQSVLSEFSILLNKKQCCQMFIEMKRKEENLTELEEILKGLDGAEVSEYNYEPDVDFRTTLGRENGLGKLVMKKTAKDTSQNEENTSKPGAATRDIQYFKASHMTDINAQSASNTYNCNISGLTLLSAERLVVSDNANSTLKLIDITSNEIVSEHKPKQSPWGVTLCGDNIAATLPTAKSIIFMKYDNALVHDREICVSGQCMGIDCSDDKLFVIFDKEKKLEIMTMAGIVLQKFETNEQGDRLFEQPAYVTVSETNKLIYVSEWGKGQLVILDWGGKLKGIYENSELGRPKQLALDTSGVMYLCDNRNNTVHLMSPRCKQMKILLTGRDRLTRPLSVCYCENTRRLYVGMYNSDTIRVFQVS